MTTSVVIPAYNGKSYLAKNLPAVMKLGADEVVIVDDASTDGTADFIAAHFPKVKLIRHLKNQRFPASVNEGIAASRGQIILLLNQDVYPTPHIIASVMPHFKDPKVFAVTFNEQDHSWAKASIKNGFLEFTNGEAGGRIHRSFWPSGGGSAFRHTQWDELGGFDTVFHPGYFEDADIGWRAHKRGWEVLWEPAAKVVHTPESAFKAAFPALKLQRNKERNYLLLQWKNMDPKNLLRHLPALAVRVIKHPGFIRPLGMALFRLPSVIRYRVSSRGLSRLGDDRVFIKFVS